MYDFEGNLTDVASYGDPPSIPSPRTILSMLNQTASDHIPITELFSESTIPKDQSSVFTSPSTVPSSNIMISPGLSPPTLLQSPNMLPSLIPTTLITNRPPETTQSSSKGHAMTLISNHERDNHQPMHIDLFPQEAVSFESEIDVNNINFMQEEANVEDVKKEENQGIAEVDEDEYKDKNEEYNMLEVDEPEVSETLAIPKKRKYKQISNMIGATRTSKQQRVIIQMESDEDHPDDGYRWRKYGRKIVQGNPNSRSYYKCTYDGCKVKKYVERGANDIKLLVTTYDGRHEHNVPAPSGPMTKNQNNSSKTNTNQAGPQLGILPSTFSPPTEVGLPSTPSDQQINMEQFFMTGLSKLPRLSVNHSSSFMPHDDQPINQNTYPLLWNGQSINHDLGLMNQSNQPVNQNPGFISQNEQSLNHNSGFMSQNTWITSQNDQLVHQNTALMFPNDFLVNQNLSFMSYYDPPVNQSNQPVDYNSYFMHRSGQPNIDMIPDGTDLYKGIMKRLSKHGARFGM